MSHPKKHIEKILEKIEEMKKDGHLEDKLLAFAMNNVRRDLYEAQIIAEGKDDEAD